MSANARRERLFRSIPMVRSISNSAPNYISPWLSPIPLQPVFMTVMYTVTKLDGNCLLRALDTFHRICPLRRGFPAILQAGQSCPDTHCQPCAILLIVDEL